MSDHIRRKTPINNPKLERALDKAGRERGRDVKAVPASADDFAGMVAAAEADLVPTRRGRPPRGTRSKPTATRSIRAPADLWRRLDAMAKRRGVTGNQLAVMAMESIS